MRKEKSKYSKQMFTVKCNVTGEEKRVRRNVFMSRVNRVQRFVRSVTGDQIPVADAINALTTNYVGIAGRKQAGCDYLGQPIEFAKALRQRTPKARKATKPATKPAVKTAPAAATPAPVAATAPAGK
jgi:hypothetical protein